MRTREIEVTCSKLPSDRQFRGKGLGRSKFEKVLESKRLPNLVDVAIPPPTLCLKGTVVVGCILQGSVLARVQG